MGKAASISSRGGEYARNVLGRWQLGDILVGIDGKPVTSTSDLLFALEEKKPGDTVRVDLLRDGRRTQAVVRLSLNRGAEDPEAGL